MVLSAGLFLASPSLAGDVTVKIDTGDGFAITDLSGTNEKIRVDEATANISRNGALFIHTLGNPAGGGLPATTVSSSLYIGRNAGNVPLAFGAHTTAVGYEAHSNQHGWGNAAFGSRAMKNSAYVAGSSAFGAFAMESTFGSPGHNSAFGYKAMQTGPSNSSTAVGHSAMIGGGTSSTAVGANSMGGNASYATAVGFNASGGNAGDSTSAFGFNALANNVQGELSAFGASALQSNTIGDFNSAFGFQSLVNNVDGNYNSAFGRSTLRSNVSGSHNSAFGAFALANDYFGSAGSDNVALGSQSLYQSIGSRNTAAGKDSMQYATTANDNSAFGHRALRNASSAFFNVAVGKDALLSLTTGYGNTAVGPLAMNDNVTGVQNVAIGTNALQNATSGNANTVVGPFAAQNQTTGQFNVAVGVNAARDNTGNNNVAIGRWALNAPTSANNVVAIGYNAGSVFGPMGNNNVFISNPGGAGDSGTIRIGTGGMHNNAFVSGIFGTTVNGLTGTMVVVDSAGHLGTINSSARFKKDVEDMGDATDVLMKLRPVSFHYLEDGSDHGEPAPQYGLIAEEVAAVAPDLVITDEHGAPLTVKYHMLAPMLLNELQRMHRTLDERDATIEAQNRALVELEQDLGARLSRLEGAGANGGPSTATDAAWVGEVR